MPIPIFVIVIEKSADGYTAYTPNIAGLSAVAKSREDVERLILQKMTRYIEDLGSEHAESQSRLVLTTAPIQERVSCSYRYPKGQGRSTCRANSQMEGLCCQHWKILYGHEVNSRDRFKKCSLCSEEDPLRLLNWNERCDFKASHHDWPVILAEKRKTESIARKESKALQLRSKRAHSSPRQCLAELKQGPKGSRCSKEATMDGYCTMHWRLNK